MKKILILFSLFLCDLWGQVWAQGVNFRDLTFQQALEVAKKEQKLVFVDCYTSWCGPCKNMLKNVFTLPEAGEFMNKSFVCVKYDMEKGEGIELRKRLGVRAFPTFFIFRSDGTMQHRLAGGCQWERFRERVERGVNEKTSLSYLDRRYASNKLSVKEYLDYVSALRDASYDIQLKEFCLNVFDKLKDNSKYKVENWFLFEQEMTPEDSRFVFLIEHKSNFEKSVGKEIVDKHIYMTLFNALTLAHNDKGNQWIDVCYTIKSQLGKIALQDKNKLECLLEYVVALKSCDVEKVLFCLEHNQTNLPSYVVYDMLMSDFIIAMGNKEQIKRYIDLGRKAEKEAGTPQLRGILKMMFDKYEGDFIERSTYAEVKGKVTKELMEDVKLYEVVDGKECLLATSKVGKDGAYGFAFEPKYSGFYTVGGKEFVNRMRLYLKPGDQAEVDILEDSLVITTRNTKENLLLARWENLMIPVRKRVDDLKYALFDYKEFFPYFMDFLPKAQQFKDGISCSDYEFLNLIRQTVDYDLDYYAFRILNALKASPLTHKPSRPKIEDYPSFYETIVAKGKLADASILKQPYGYDYLQRYTTFACVCENLNISLENRLEWLSDDLLKAEMILWQMEKCRKYEDYMKIFETYGTYLTTDNHQKRLDAVSAKLYKGVVGKKASDFTYPDRNGKMVSLSDFLGKVVVVDVWATWCGPCRAEIPHLVKLEKEMKGKDVVFIGVSVDAQKDHGKWVEVLEKEGLEGVQLFANGADKRGKDKIMNDYKIKGIPRFMVFDKKGNVVTLKSPRPSSRELKKLIEMELRK